MLNLTAPLLYEPLSCQHDVLAPTCGVILRASSTLVAFALYLVAPFGVSVLLNDLFFIHAKWTTKARNVYPFDAIVT